MLTPPDVGVGGCSVKNIRFYNISEVENLWDEFDLIFTNDDPIIKSKPVDKKVYTIDTSKEIESEYILESPIEITNLNIFKKENV